MSHVQATFEVQILRPTGWRAVRAADSESKAMKQAMHYAMISEVSGVRVVCNVKTGQRIHIVKAPTPENVAPQIAKRYRAPWWMPQSMAKHWENLDTVQRDTVGRLAAAAGAVVSLGGIAFAAERMVSDVSVLMR